MRRRKQIATTALQTSRTWDGATGPAAQAVTTRAKVGVEDNSVWNSAPEKVDIRLET